jgi:hypothetical protein
VRLGGFFIHGAHTKKRLQAWRKKKAGKSGKKSEQSTAAKRRCEKKKINEVKIKKKTQQHTHNKDKRTRNNQKEELNMADSKKLAYFIPGLESSFVFSKLPVGRELEYEDKNQDESIAEYIRFLDMGASKPEKQAFYESVHENLKGEFDKVDIVEKGTTKEAGNYKKLFAINEQVENLHSKLKRETKDEPLVEFPDLRWHFFDTSVKLWGMKLGFEAGAPNFVVPAQFRTTSFPHFYDLVYKYMLNAPDRERVLSSNNQDSLQFLKLSMESVVVDAVLYQATFGLRTPVTGNILVESNKITCKALFRNVSELLHHGVCHKLGWNMTTAVLQKEVKECNDAKHKTKYSSFYNCEMCFKLNHGKDGDFKKQVKAMIVLRVLLCDKVFKRYDKLEEIIFNGANGWSSNGDIDKAINEILILTKTWTIADAVSVINKQGVEAIYPELVAKFKFLDVFKDNKTDTIAKLFLDPGAISQIKP